MLVHMNKENPMPNTGHLIVLRGLPGSGKTSFAKSANLSGSIVLSRVGEFASSF